jgi:hypothetical protein
MERGNPDLRSLASGCSQQVSDALFHHARCFIRERDGENRIGRHALFDQVRDAIGDHARLARPRARQDEHRPFGFDHCFALAFVETGE